jgi:putative permease
MNQLKAKQSELPQIVFFVSIFLIGAIVLFTLPRLTIPLTLGYVLYLISKPAIPALMRLKLSRTVSVIIIFIGMIFCTVYPVIKVVPIVTREVKNFQYYFPKVESYIKREYRIISDKVKDKTGIEIGDKFVDDGIGIAKKSTTSLLLNAPTILASVVEWIFLVPLFVFFLLKDGVVFKRLVLRLVPNSIFERFYFLSHQFNKQLGDYIFAKFIEASIVGILITVGLFFMDIRFSLLLGIVAGLTNIIPYLGPILGMIPAVIVGMAEYGFGATFGGMMLLYIISNAVDIALVFPILVSKIVDLHPIVVVISVILGSQTMGIMGMVISIPVAAAVKLIFLEIYGEIYSSRTR